MHFGGPALSVATGSLGTADLPASSPSLYGLDGVNFFLAAALAGFGPYVAAYLADQKWTQTDIGLALTAGGVAGLLSQLPGGELLDKVRSKRAVIAVGASIAILSAFILAFWPRLPSVFIALVLQGATGGGQLTDGDDEVVCNVACWRNSDQYGAYLTVEISPKFVSFERRGSNGELFYDMFNEEDEQ